MVEQIAAVGNHVALPDFGSGHGAGVQRWWNFRRLGDHHEVSRPRRLEWRQMAGGLR
ncbi:MAG TPA: hypothetical protein VLZ55_02890 [Rhodanobacter sp.]|nr:hypothetical protein [Rhodanobacter sp.]